MLTSLLVVGVLIVIIPLYIWWKRMPYAHIPGVTQLGPFLPIKLPLVNKYMGGGAESPALEQLFRSGFVKDGVLRITACGVSRLFISDPDLIKDIALTRAKLFPKPPVYDILNIWGENIVSTNDSAWKKHRVVADPAFAENHMNYLVKESAKCINLSINRMEKSRSAFGLVINATEEMQDVTLDIIGKVAFGYDLGVFAPKDPVQPHKMTFENALKLTMTLGILVGGVLPKWARRFFPQTDIALNETELYMRELIKYRMDNLYDTGKHDLLSLLVSSNAEQIKETSLTDQELVSDVFIFLVAGHETSATTLSWMLYELMLNKHVQDKMYEEVKTVLSGLKFDELTVDTYEKLTYTKCAVTETLRKHPPVSGVPKMTRTDTTIGKYLVPKNTEIYLDVAQVQKNEKYWPDAKTFKPERFDPESSEYHKVKSCSFLPFSLGQRKCIGSKFSEIETAILIAYIVLNYEINNPKGDVYMNSKEVLQGDIRTESRITQSPLGLRVELKKRQA
ncbi:Cyp4x1 [Acrasis kona]|uniref:Cyp4x1 n=1 Tax=Acrasis kona TaxID=1008807 RepID=A0AAW2YJ50_9EUKA